VDGNEEVVKEIFDLLKDGRLGPIQSLDDLDRFVAREGWSYFDTKKQAKREARAKAKNAKRKAKRKAFLRLLKNRAKLIAHQGP